MKYLWLIIAPIILLSNSFNATAQHHMLLSHFLVSEEGGEEFLPIQVPSALQAELIKQGKIPHHFIGGNEDSVQWVSDRNWLYTTTFNIDEADLSSAKEYRLLLEWVDTYSEVYLNGVRVGTTQNLFRKYAFPIAQHLKPGQNHLVIRLLSPTRIAHAHYLSSGFNYPADNDRNHIKYSPFVRKSPYHFGWDWGPRMVTLGLGTTPVIERITGSTLASYYVHSTIEWESKTSTTPKRAFVQASTTIEYPTEGETITLTLLAPNGKKIAEHTEQIQPKKQNYTLNAEVKAPQLWMPNGWGEQPLYTLVRTINGANHRQSHSAPFGIREVHLLQKPDEVGQSFTFIVNNRPLYVKGANYLPHDRRFGGGGRTLNDLFRYDLVPAHFNMLRVWGGGTYETEEFYQLADKYGILIWQDFPFACTTYPTDAQFLANVEQEVKDQLTRLRNHPSLAFLCGNNEVLEGLKHWGWKEKYEYSDAVWAEMHNGYNRLFRTLLPSLVHKYAPHLNYMHGSPFNSNWGIPQSFLSSDAHNWRVWFGGKDFTEFDLNPGRFASEFGFQSFPEMKTIQSFAPGYNLDTLTIHSPILKHRQRSFIGNQRITEYMQRHYPVPTTFSHYVHVGQLLQGRGIGYALRALRRAYPLNMGALYWQLNDVWPTVSWSSIDYWGNYKALHYEVKQAYAPYIIDIAELQEGTLSLWVVTDNPHHTGEMQAKALVKDYQGNEIHRVVFNVPATSAPFAKKIVTASKHLLPSQQLYIELQLYNNEQQLVATQVYYPAKPEEMQLQNALPTITHFTSQEGQLELTLQSPTLIYGLFIGTPWQGARYSQNYFDLLPGQPYTITITHPLITSNTTAQHLTFLSLNQILHQPYTQQ